MVALRLDGLTRTFPGGASFPDGLSLDVADGEVLMLVGPSGCGKTTVLRLIAGLDRPTAGRILLDGRDVTRLPPRDRGVSLVFQNPVLYPHLRVRDNLGFALHLAGEKRMTIADRVTTAADALGLTPYLDRFPSELSGGERQRVALGRALVRRPRVFLLDEPLSRLDALLRVQARAELTRLHRLLGATTVHVTHDQEEALALGDRIAVLRDGRLQQVGTPHELYDRPANAFVGEFIGWPPMNLLRGTVEANAFRAAGLVLPLTPDWQPPGGDLLLGIRPQNVHPAGTEPPHLTGTVETVQPLGHVTVLGLQTPAGRLTLTLPPSAGPVVGEELGVRLDAGRVHGFAAADGARQRLE